MHPLLTKIVARLDAMPRRNLLAGGFAVLVLGTFLVMNFGYFSAHVSYALRPPQSSVATDDAPAPIPTVTPDRLWIPAIGLSDVPIVMVTERSEEAYQAAVRSGVGHFPGTAAIGQPGNPYLFGHSSDYVWAEGSYKTVFALLPKLQPGDEILASDSAGIVYRYLVTETFIVAPDDFTVLDQFKNEKRLLTLQTSYPLGTALKRYIVRAELAE